MKILNFKLNKMSQFFLISFKNLNSFLSLLLISLCKTMINLKTKCCIIIIKEFEINHIIYLNFSYILEKDLVLMLVISINKFFVVNLFFLRYVKYTLTIFNVIYFILF